AVGDPMNARLRAMTRSNCALDFARTIWSVLASTGVIEAMALTESACGDASFGSTWRSQLNFTASASNGVPSVNLRRSRSLRVQVTPSLDSMDSASEGTTLPLE